MALGAATSLLISSTAAAPQTNSPIPVVHPTFPDAFREVYDQTPNTNASDALVGLRLGRSDSTFDPTRVLIALPPDTSTPFCVRVVTADGRFNSENPFNPPMLPNRGGTVRLSSVTRDFSDLLRTYSGEDAAVRAYVTSDGDCRSSPAGQLPQIADLGSDTLEVLLSIGNQVAEAELLSGGEIVAARDCGLPDTSMRFAFDTLCELPVGSVKGRTLNLRVTVRDGFLGSSTGTWTLWLPDSNGR
ncbi:MAG: hypothetical protein AAFQ11_07320 [Pseudomonadota bacterium]